MKKNLFFVLLLCSVLQGTSQTPAEFKSPADRYRPKPLWFWNNTTVTRKGIDTQLKALKEQAGYGGVSILPFGAKFGPKYLSPEYFDLYEYTAEKAEALGMQLSLYDEYGFPSGSGGAALCGVSCADGGSRAGSRGIYGPRCDREDAGAADGRLPR